MPSIGRTEATINGPRASIPIRGAVRLAWLLASSAAVLAPAAVLGDTGPGTTGGPSTEPEISPLSGLIEVVVPLALILGALGVVIGIVVGLAFLVARIGGPAVAPTAALGAAEPKRSRSAMGTMLSVLVAVGATVVGVLAGRAIAYRWGVGGFGVNDGAVLTIFLVMAVVALLLIGLIATKIRHGYVSQAIGTFLAGTGLLVAGALGGFVSAPASGGLYYQPVVLDGAGQTHAELQAGVIPFVARDGGRADCRSVPDGPSVAGVTALDVGELGSGTLRAMLVLPAQSSEGATVELFIDGGDLPEGSPQLSWSGPAQVTELGAEGATGTLTFTGLELSDPAAKGESGSSVPASATPGWPATISGSLAWTCQPWATPLPDSVAPPPSTVP